MICISCQLYEFAEKKAETMEYYSISAFKGLAFHWTGLSIQFFTLQSFTDVFLPHLYLLPLFLLLIAPSEYEGQNLFLRSGEHLREKFNSMRDIY